MADGRTTQRHSEHDEDEGAFTVSCPHSWYYDWDLYECKQHDHWDDDDWWINLIALLLIAIVIYSAICFVPHWIHPSRAAVVVPPAVHVHHKHKQHIENTVISSSSNVTNNNLTQRQAGFNIRLGDD
jgi:hypothetical protein